MKYECPECERDFDEKGFCPYDGTQLVSPFDGTALVQQSTFEVEPTAPGPKVEQQLDDKKATSTELTSTLPPRASPPPKSTPPPRSTPPPKSTPPPRSEPPPKSDPPTVLSAYHQAQDVPTQEPTHKVQALSASDDSDGRAKAALRDRVDEYDRLVGETLDGRYYVKEKLGEGGMGVVFAARHAVIERPLAIKVLKREATRDPATIQRFVQEAKASSRIGHPNIVEVTDFGTTSDGLTYSVMELVEGSTLSKTIKASAPFPPERVVRIAMQIARAIGAAHGKGIVHRDLKPENVFLLDRDGRPDFVKIVDFGIAKVQPVPGTQETRRLTKSGSVFGTPEYMAPEQAAGRNDTDGRVDIYALGTIMYEMLTGRVPHKGGSTVRTIAMQMLDPIAPMKSVNPELAISPAFESVVMKALAKNRDERYQTMAEVAAALDPVAAQLAKADAQTVDLPVGLPPLPPGADLDTIPEVPSDQVPPKTQAQPAASPRRSKPLTKQLHEPQFVAGPLTLEHAFAPDEPLETEKKRAVWPWIALAVLGFGTAATAIALYVKGEHSTMVSEAPHDAAEPAHHSDAQVIAQLADAGVAAPPDDAAVTDPNPLPAPHDAGVIALHDAGTHGPHILPPPHPATVTIEVLTRPAETDVFSGHEYLGMSGVRIRRPWGTTLQIECKAPHYHGRKTLIFDGSTTSIMCMAQRLKMCVPGLKNPYDECEEPGPVTNPTP